MVEPKDISEDDQMMEGQDDDNQEAFDADGTMITALCWVSRGFAKPILKEGDIMQDEKLIKQHMKAQKKISK